MFIRTIFTTLIISLTCSASPLEQVKVLQQQDTLTDAQIDHFSAPGRWLGPGWWANRLQDWSRVGVRNKTIIQCAPNSSFLPWRVAHDMIRPLDLSTGNLDLSVNVTLQPASPDISKPLAPDSLAGVLIGTGNTLDDPMARMMVFGFHKPKKSTTPYAAVSGSGIAVGFSGDGHLRIIDLDSGKVFADAPHKLSKVNPLHVQTRPGPKGGITLIASSGDTKISAVLPKERFKGGIALTSHAGTRSKNHASLVSSFSSYQPKSGFKRDNAQAVGPIATAQYTVQNGILKLSAQCLPQPLGTTGTISFFRDGKWTKAAEAEVHPIDQLALFRIENWDMSKAVPYRVSLPLQGSKKPATFTGLITANPSQGNVRLALLGGILHRPWGEARNWRENLNFPHHDIQKRVLAKHPDTAFFYGDQIYEATPSPVDRNDYFTDYLYKWLFHCVAFRETLRNMPTVTVPDDHDVFQGNYWGDGGIKAPHNNWNYGGYVHPAAFVAQVHRTQTAHLPDAYDPHCLKRNIPAYHTSWEWGGVSFAILGDRYFKSGPAGNGLPETKTTRPDHYNNPEFDTKDLDVPGLQLLGKPQEEFLEHWAADWSHGTQLKALLSQSPFANLATHHSGQYIIADLDSNGWPQSGRNRALRILRKARAVHIAGDQHLATLVQHGIDEFGDSIYSFAGPSVANAYARAFYPANHGYYYDMAPPKPSDYLGNRLDGFKNKVTFYGCANPDATPNSIYRTPEHADRNVQVPGFGIIDFNTKDHTITFDCKPRSAIVESRLKNGSYPGWPLTIKASQNDGRQPVANLLTVKNDGSNPVVRVWGPDGKLESAQRMSGKDYHIYAYQYGMHKIEIGDGNGKWETFDIEAKKPTQ